jgi:DNA-cytosine methyltransferase
MNVLSLFDGISCGQVALKNAGIKVDNFYASEIDKYTIKITQNQHPKTNQLGDIQDWRDWDLPPIDLIMGGSPCQGFSFAGKQLNFEDSRSKLFFDFVDIVKHYKPKYFLLENVKMKKEYQDVITNLLGVEPILINSALVSAQNRNRLYWTNIPNITQPNDEGILLKDILVSGAVDRYKSHCLDANYFKGGNLKSYFEKHRRQLVFEAKNGKNVTINMGDIYSPKTFYETRTEFGKQERKRLSKLNGRDTTPRDKKCKHYITQPHNKANCIVTVDSFLNWVIDENYYCRKLTPVECERLQTLPDNYTGGVSNTQRYKALGNGWTVDVVTHIFKNMVV